ncbi:glycosyl hydrolase, partial [bacterium]|nr:glycosyl hydrolase [bacterium]
LGTVHDIARIKINGKDLGVVWTAPWQVEILDELKVKDNTLEIEVVNRWVNRLIGDMQDQDAGARTVQWDSGYLEGKQFKTGRYTFTTHQFYQKTSKILPSGLLGPVEIKVLQE